MLINSKRLLLLILIAFISFNTIITSSAAEKVRIAVFQWSTSEEIYSRSLKGFTEALAEYGYQIGGNLVIDTFEARENPELARQLIQKIKKAQYNLVLSLGTKSTQILIENNLTDTPVVFSGVFDPISAGLASSTNGSKTNYTGTAHRQPLYKQFKFFHQFVPTLKRLGIIYGENEPSVNYQLSELEQEKSHIGLTEIILKPVSSHANLKEAVTTLAGKVDAIYLPAHSTITDNTATNLIINLAQKYKIPVCSALFDPVKQGALSTVYTDIYGLAEQAGKMAAMILEGEDPGQIPIAYQHTPSYGINLNTIKELGLTIPEYLPVKFNSIIGKHFAFMPNDTAKFSNHKPNQELSLGNLNGEFELKTNGKSLAEILDEITEVTSLAGIPLNFTQIGSLNVPIQVHIKDTNLAALIHRLVRKAGFLAVQRQDDFIIYGDEAATILNGKKINYIYRLKALNVETVLEKLDHFRDNLRIYSIKENNSISLTGPLTDIQEAVSFLESIDYQKPIISIELLIVQYRHGNQFKWGIDIANGQYGHFSGVNLSPGAQQPVSITYKVEETLKPSFTLNLRQLIEDGRARVITNPHLAVRNGEKAMITLLQKKYIQMENIDNDTNVKTYTLTELQAGVSLEVVPTLTDDQLILLMLNGELSVFIESIAGEYAIDKNTINTSVNIYDGQTLIIGGLIKKEESTSEGGVPGLKDLWLAGKLFKTKTQVDEYVETVLYITPHIHETNNTNGLRLRTHYLTEMEEEERKSNNSKK